MSSGLSLVMPNIRLLGKVGLSLLNGVQKAHFGLLECLMDIPEVTVASLEGPLFVGVEVSTLEPAVPEPHVVDNNVLDEGVSVDADLHVHLSDFSSRKGRFHLLFLFGVREQVFAEGVQVIELFEHDELIEVQN